RPAAAQYPHPVAVAVPLAVLEGILFQFAGVLAIRLGGDPLAIVGMEPRQPCLARRIDLFVEADAAHLPPHRREERLPVAEVMVPDALPGAFQAKFQRLSLSASASSARLRAVMSRLTPTMPTMRPAGSRSGNLLVESHFCSP